MCVIGVCRRVRARSLSRRLFAHNSMNSTMFQALSLRAVTLPWAGRQRASTCGAHAQRAGPASTTPPTRSGHLTFCTCFSSALASEMARSSSFLSFLRMASLRTEGRHVSFSPSPRARPRLCCTSACGAPRGPAATTVGPVQYAPPHATRERRWPAAAPNQRVELLLRRVDGLHNLAPRARTRHGLRVHASGTT